MVGIWKEAFDFGAKEIVNKTRFEEDDDIETVIGFVEEGFGSEMFLSGKRASHTLI